MSRLTEQHLTEADLGRVKGLIHYLNENVTGELRTDVAFTDSNGEHAGDLRYNVDLGAYVFVYMVETDA